MKRSRGYKDWRRRKTITGSGLLRSLALECREDGIRHLVHLWKELCAQQTVREDLAEEFAGEDILLPEQREQVEDTRARLLAAADAFGARQLLAERDDEFAGVYQRTVNEAFSQLNLTEPYE